MEWNPSCFSSLFCIVVMITGKKTGRGEEADDKQLIALLRSQIFTYQSENEQLKHKQLQVNIFCKVISDFLL